MSADTNIQIVQRAYADFSRGNVAAVLAIIGEDIQWLTPGNSATAGERQGKDEVAAFFRTLQEQWEFLAFEAAEYIAQEDRVVALGRYEVRSRHSHRTAASHWAMVWTFRDGKAVRFQEYTDTAALEEAASAVEVG